VRRRLPAPAAGILAALALWAGGLAGCDADRPCGGGEACAGDAICRPAVGACPGTDHAVTLGAGQCRDRGARCASDLDCVPEEICAADGLCRPGSRCDPTPPQPCPAGCTWGSPFPCSCICGTCPATSSVRSRAEGGAPAAPGGS